jgi:hypothetical protein
VAEHGVTINGKFWHLIIDSAGTAPALVAGTKMFPAGQNKEVHSAVNVLKYREWQRFQWGGFAELKKSPQRPFYLPKMDISRAKSSQVLPKLSNINILSRWRTIPSLN